MSIPTYLTFIPFVNGRELLLKALGSIECMWPNTIVIDNSAQGNLELPEIPVRIYRPDVPLWFAQSQNLMQQLAIAANVEVFFFLHHDAQVLGNGAQLFLDMLEKANPKWGAVFCQNYDCFCCFKTEAIKAVGPWDWQLFPWYYSDSDYYRRLRLQGYDTLTIPELVVEHHNGGSNSLAQDEELKVKAILLMKYSYHFYIIKWGGEPHSETFNLPYNGNPLKAQQDLEAKISR